MECIDEVLEEGGGTRRRKRENYNKNKTEDISGDVLGKPYHPYNRWTWGSKGRTRTSVKRKDGTLTFTSKHGDPKKREPYPLDRPYGSRKYGGSFRKMDATAKRIKGIKDYYDHEERSYNRKLREKLKGIK